MTPVISGSRGALLSYPAPQPRSISPELESVLVSYFHPIVNFTEMTMRTANYRSHLRIPSPPRWVVTFEMRQRLEELNWRTQPHSVNNGDHGEAVEDWDSKPSEIVAS